MSLCILAIFCATSYLYTYPGCTLFLACRPTMDGLTMIVGNAAMTQQRTTQRSGLVEVNLAVVCFGLAGVLGKLSMLPAPLIVLGRVLFACLTLAALAWVRHLSIKPQRRRDLALLLAQGVLLAIHWTSFFESINVSTVAIGLLSFSSFPLFAAFLEPLLLRERLNRAQVIAACAILPGVYLLVPSLSLGNSTTIGVLWGIFAGATFALLSVTNRWLGRSYTSITISLYQESTATIVLLPTLVFLHPAALGQPRELLILLILGIVCTALAHTLFIEGLRTVTAQLASLLATLEPVWGIAFALLLLGEIPTIRTLIGGAIILAATAIATLARGPSSDTSAAPDIAA